MKKAYIEDFCEDLNYRGIVLYVDSKIDFSDLLAQLVKANLSHLYRFDAVKENRLFYIENCDLQDVTINQHWNEFLNLLDEGHSILQLKKDANGYYIDVPDVYEWKESPIPETEQEKRYVYEVHYDDDWDDAHFSCGTFDSMEKAKAEVKDRLEDYDDMVVRAEKRKHYSIYRIEVK